MPRYDPDVIAALAEGLLDPEEAATVEREIAADPAAATQLAELRIALEATAEAARPELTMSERSDLRAAVADALGITTPEVVAPAPRRIPWGPLGIAAAALAGLIAVVPVVGLLSTGGADDAATLNLAAEAAPTTIAEQSQARSAAVEETESAVVAADADDALTIGDASGADAPAFGSSTTLPATTTSPPPAAVTTQAATSSEGSTTTTTADAAVEQLTAELEVIRSSPEFVNEFAVEAIQDHECWAKDGEIRADPPPQRFVFEYDNGELTVIVYFELEEGVAGPFQVWDLPDCGELLVIP